MPRKSIVQIKRSEVKQRRSGAAGSTTKNRSPHKSTQTSFKRQRTLTEFNIPTSSNFPVRSSTYSFSRFDHNTNRGPVLIDDIDRDSICPDDTEKVEIIIDTDDEDLVSLYDGEMSELEIRTDKSTKDRITTELKEQINVEISTESINCPICSLNLSHLELHEREAHCDICIGSERDNRGTPKKNVKNIVTNPSSPTKAKRQLSTLKKPTRIRPDLPSFKIIKFKNDHEIVVDGFNYKSSETISQYFLSHFHSDHYIGLKKSWNNPDDNSVKKTLYCSKVTALLVNMKFKIPMDEIQILPMNKRFWITDTISVVTLDANHCPGAIIMLFQEFLANSHEKPIKQVLHTGDFRSNAQMIKTIQKWLSETTNDTIDQIYLDTTYLTMGYNFPSQNSVCDIVADFTLQLIKQGKNKIFSDSQRNLFHFQKKKAFTSQHHNFLFLVGTYTIGKEKLAIRICEFLKTKLFVSPNSVKFSIIQTVLRNNENENVTWDEDLLTNNLHESFVHLVPIRVLKSRETIETYLKSLKELESDYLKDVDDVVGFIPTGWCHNFGLKYQKDNDNADEMASNMGYCLKLMKNDQNDHESKFEISSIMRQYRKYNKFQVFNVPYSEHSSFDDLVKFGCKLKWAEIIPTVNLNNLSKVRSMSNLFQCWESVRKKRAAK